ncbi:MAG: hypothetical protein WAN87_03135 [Thermoplasmata archaeon]
MRSLPAPGGSARSIILDGPAAPPVGPASAQPEASYTVTFTETGLPFGMGVPDNGPNITWEVQLGNWTGQATATSTSSSIPFTGVPNGTYPFNIPGVVSNFGVNASTPSYGNLTVNGGNVGWDVSFDYSRAYPVTFISPALPSGANWSVIFDGVSFPSNPEADTINIGPPQPTTNGSYRFALSGVAGYRGTPTSGVVTVAGSWTNVTIAWTRVLYNVTFFQTGQPDGSQWGIGLNPPTPPTMDYGGGTENTTTSTLVFQVSNGTFSFIVDTSPTWLATPGSGSITVNGAPVNETIGFVRAPPGKVWVTFIETGLPSGASWSVILNGTMTSSSSLTIDFGEPNGTYTATIPSVGGLGPTPANVTIKVPGITGPLDVLFQKIYPVNFTESDLSAGTNWSVSITGNSTESVLLGLAPFDMGSISVTRWSGGALTIQFYLSNGTYTYSSSAPGQTGSSAPLDVNGVAPSPIALTFHPTPASNGTILGEPYWVFAAIGGIVVAVIVALLLVRRKRKAAPAVRAAGLS